MKNNLILLLIIIFHLPSYAQQVIDLPYDHNPSVEYATPERQFFSDEWQTTVVTNVSKPSITVFQPSEEKKNGTAVIIAPGGGLYGLSIHSEGVDVAHWLVAHGITAFVLKYRLVPSGEDGTSEINELMQNDSATLFKRVRQVLPNSVDDGLQALSYVREHATDYGIQPDKIGFMGFSAGGAVALGVAYQYEPSNRPDFLVPIYPWTTAQPVQSPQNDAPPMLVICATNDGLGLANGSIALYQSWHQNQFNAALHMYSQGDHGFGMKTQGFPSDHWIERFYEWAVVEHLVAP